MVNVTKSNFIEESNDLIRRLPSAAFVAIDAEMTGISIPNSPRPPKDQTPNERYGILKAVPEKFSIIQLGVCLFHEHPDYSPDEDTPEFVSRRYNFFMFPPPDNKITREVVLNASSIAFLSQHQMDFDLWTRQGTPYVTTNVAEDLISKFQQTQLDRQHTKAVDEANAYKPGRRRVELRRAEDIDFHARAMASLREWLDSPRTVRNGADNNHNNVDENNNHIVGEEEEIHPNEGLSFLFPPANSFLRRALYESVALEYPALKLENAGANHPNQIRVLRLNAEEARNREERLMRESWEELMVHRIGVWRVFMALSLACHGLEIPTDSITFATHAGGIDWAKGFELQANLQPTFRQVPLIVHNGYMDLMFMMTHFHSHKLPPLFSEAKSLIHSYFPMIFDTKYMVTECARPSLGHGSSTALEDLYVKVVCEQDDSGLVELDVHPSGNSGEAHDAAYDAFMTGAVYAALCRHISHINNFTCDAMTSPATYRRIGSLSHLLCDHNDELVRELFGRNKLYLMQSIYSVDLETEEDPHWRGMIPEAIFRVSNFDPSVTTRTIIQCLSELVDTRGENVNFELFWCNETTFLVAASSKMLPRSDTRDIMLREHGVLILKALKTSFPTARIVSWVDRNAGEEQQETTWSSRALNLFQRVMGWSSNHGAKKRENDVVATPLDPPPKRRRIR